MLRLDDIVQYTHDSIAWTMDETESSFSQNDVLFRAVLYNLQVIGEAVKGLPEEVKQMDALIPWRAIAGLRDVLAHAYFRIDAPLVWEVVREQLPEFLKRVVQIRISLRED